MYRGTDFWPQYRKLLNIRCCLSNTPLLRLSATVTTGIVDDILQVQQLCRDDVVIKSTPPDRPNIFIEVASSTDSADTDLSWVIRDIVSKQSRCPKTLIFAKLINSVAEIFTAIVYSLRANAHSHSIQMVSMYHAQILEPLQQHAVTEFTKTNSVIRVLV